MSRVDRDKCPVHLWISIYDCLRTAYYHKWPHNGMSLAVGKVFETNTASLQNLRKQKFEVFNQYFVYEHTLPAPKSYDSSITPISVREIGRSDGALFKEIEDKTISRSVLSVKGSTEPLYFLSGWQKMYA